MVVKKHVGGWNIFGVGDLLDPKYPDSALFASVVTTLAECRLSQCFLYPYGLFSTITAISCQTLYSNTNTLAQDQALFSKK